ncbi:calcium transporting ATPase [Russula earlei]|uniref:Calcium transporting ATPase n=1 Tax=Russula earlei TaxID=71964 RepID=A0ACC0U4Q7_9AGAM|nr:calcium transporting ATPase [Russula earlei]
MGDDFSRLVFQANPASSLNPQYQRANDGYPPSRSPLDGSHASPQFLDPFFDDEDEGEAPDVFSGAHSMQAKESKAHLPAQAAPLAGVSKDSLPNNGVPQGWTFDQDDPPVQTQQPSRGPKRTPRRRWRWPWQKDQVLTAERIVALNNPDANTDFLSNYVSTTKYNMVTFVPKFLFEQFSKYANLFFLFTACIQQIPGVSPTNKWTTIAPLSFVLLVSAFKEVQEDLKRNQSDIELNSRRAKVLIQTGSFDPIKWKNIKVGDVIRLENDDFIPADVILLSSSEPEGFCYIETSNLDGETNLKIKQASPQTSDLTSPNRVTALRGSLRSEHPNNSLYTYEGALDLITSTGYPKQVPLGPDQMLLRGAQIRNTSWAYGLVVFTGHETKLMRNATAAPIKRTAVENQVNTQIVFLFILLLALSVGSTIGASIRSWFFASKQWYLMEATSLGGRAKEFIEDILTFIILYNNLIPISLIVTMEVVKFQQAQLINTDLDMYYAKTDTPALCRTSSLVEELGQIEYVFSDKTGTLTRNEMEFRCCSIAGAAYAAEVDEARREEGEGRDAWRTFDEMGLLLGADDPFVDSGRTEVAGSTKEREIIREFLTLLAVCHTVIPEIKNEKMVYQASSPDEAALVAGAELLGFRFTMRKPKSVFVDVLGVSQEFQILNVCEFNSTRKRMSTIVRGPDGKIKLYCKGADTVILERLAPSQIYTEKTCVHLEDYATDGLRTLCIAYREISESEYKQWSAIYDQAVSTINGRGEALDKAAEIIEKDLFLLGATAIEDKLQEGVPDAIHTLQLAGIKVWVLTGDRQETAINIGMSCRLITESMNLIIINEENMHDTKDTIERRLTAVKSQRSSGELEDLALIIDGKSLTYALEKELSGLFLELAIMCKAVICCRVSPLQKALVVKLVKKNLKSILLAIGDGANDVSMIQAAHVGVGISGVEGLQAARSADIAISQFRYLKKLLLVHGAWSYRRLATLILYSFYKNIVLYMTQFWFSFFNNFSGQIAYESWTLTFYNVLFTLLPPLVIGIFDQFVSARILDRYPQLYLLGQSNAFFTKTAFWLWIGNALYHSIVAFGFSIILFWGDLKQPSGYDSGHWFWGTMLYLAVLLTVLGKAALVSDIWTKYTVAAIPGSFVFTMLFLPLYVIVAPNIGFSLEYRGLDPRLFTDSVFWFTILLVPAICLCRDFVWKYYRRTYIPASYHIAQEIQKYNIPDYRPRQTQFQNAIKKVRAVQRMRRNRGFAFSQTEDPARQDQSRLIRAYDTSKAHARPSGY